MTKATIVCVPGAWHTPEIYSKVMDMLNAHGYPIIGLPLPSVGAMPSHVDFTEDVNGMRNCLTRLVVSEEKDVVLVTHSYTGMPGAEAPIGPGKKEREEKGLQGGVVRLVFIMAFAMSEGFQPTAGGAQMPEWMKVDLEVRIGPPAATSLLPCPLTFKSDPSQNGVVYVSPEDAKRILFYNDIPSSEADKWATKLQLQSLGVYSSNTTYAAWRSIPSTFVIGTEDKTTFTPEIVDVMVYTAKQLQPSAFDVAEKCDGGHYLMISRPVWLAGVLRRAAGEAH